jgi:feruloyl esterase
MAHRRIGIACAALVTLAPSAGAQTRLNACEELMNFAIPAAEIGLPSTGATVTVARRLAEAPPRQDPDGEFAQGVPAHCNIQGQIRPVDPAAPPIAFNVNLPFAWSGRALQSGGGGVGGALITAPGQKASARLDPVPTIEQGRGAILNFAAVWIRHAIVGDPAAEPMHFTPLPHARRIQYLSTWFDATNPDLSRFRARGGRRILLQPSADNAVGTPMIAEYYRSVVAILGQRETDGFMRFYVGHGGGHNVTGPSQIDTLSMLEAWLDGTPPPDAPVAHDIDPATQRTVRSMPACRYPAYARYNGAGDPNVASSFTCTARPDPLAFAPN